MKVSLNRVSLCLVAIYVLISATGSAFADESKTNAVFSHGEVSRNMELVRSYYSAYESGDFKTMQGIYASNITFQDPVFGSLDSDQTRAMVEMLASDAKNLRFTLSGFDISENEGTVDWVAEYTFKPTPMGPSNSVVNQGHATFRFENGQIVSHVDEFDLRSWIAQAFRPIAVPPSIVKKLVQKKLSAFISKHPEYTSN
jgi:ketosteroid isomerase-like protein